MTNRDGFHTVLKNHTHVLNALRETQIEHGRMLRQHDARFDGLEARMADGFRTLAVGQAQITALLAVAIGQSDGKPPPG